MSTEISLNNASSKSILSELSTGFRHLKSALDLKMRRRVRYRRTLAELEGLSSRELADIGIHRNHIRRLAIEEAMKVQANEA